MKENFVSGGRNPNFEKVCDTCVYLIRDRQYSAHGWCCWDNASVTIHGYCDKHKEELPKLQTT